MDKYRVLPHRDVRVRVLHVAAYVVHENYEHVPCGMDLKRQDIEDNWCPHCPGTINKAAKKRANAEWGRGQ